MFKQLFNRIHYYNINIKSELFMHELTFDIIMSVKSSSSFVITIFAIPTILLSFSRLLLSRPPPSSLLISILLIKTTHPILLEKLVVMELTRIDLIVDLFKQKSMFIKTSMINRVKMLF